MSVLFLIASPQSCHVSGKDFMPICRSNQDTEKKFQLLYPLGPFHFTLTCPPQSPSLMSKMSIQVPPSTRIRTAVSQAIQTASSVSQKELSRRRTRECKCDRLTRDDWQVKPLVNCLLLLTLMYKLLGCNTVGGVGQLDFDTVVPTTIIITLRVFFYFCFCKSSKSIDKKKNIFADHTFNTLYIQN